MKNSSRAALAVAPILLLLAGPSNAMIQANPSNADSLGLASAWPLGVHLVGGPANKYPVDGEIYVRGGGANARVAQAWSTTGFAGMPEVPNYATVHEILLNEETVKLPIDAHSTENANLPPFLHADGSDFDGSPDVEGYFGICTSIAADETGLPGSQFQKVKTEVVGYYFEDSGSIDPVYPGSAFSEFKRRSLAMGRLSTAELRAMDFGIGFVSYRDVNIPEGMFNDEDFYYFSVTRDFADSQIQPLIPEVPGVSPAHFAHAGDIYSRAWLGSGWGDVQLLLSYNQLGLTANGDVDGLDLKIDDGVVTVIFSTVNELDQFPVGVLPTSQLMVCVVESNQIHGPKPLRDGTTRVTAQIKINDGSHPNESDEVTSVCCIDPEFLSGVVNMGAPIYLPPQPGPKMGMSIARGLWRGPQSSLGNPGLSTMSIDVTGWAGVVPGTHKMRLYRSLATAPYVWSQVAIQPRYSFADTTTFHFENLPGGSGGYDDYLFRAVLTSSQGGRLAESVTTLIEMID